MADNGQLGEKAVDRRVLESSVQTFRDDARAVPADASYVLWIAHIAQNFIPWGGNVKARDRQLRAFFATEGYFMSALGTVCARNAGFSWSLEGGARTVGLMQTMLHQANFGAGWLDFIIKLSMDLYCLAGTSTVTLGGERRGRVKSIRSIVADRDPGPVMTVGDDGSLVERQINQWHRSPLGGRLWWWIATTQSGHARGERGGLFLTEDHPVLTQDGWLPAAQVQVGMSIATGHPTPNVQQERLITGMLLGDSSISRAGRFATLRMIHRADDIEWLRTKRAALAGFTWTPEREQRYIAVNSRVSSALVPWRERWYPDGRKRICRDDVLRAFSPLMLAAWYGDDGSFAKNANKRGGPTRPGVFLSTQGLPEEDVAWLAELLTERGYPAKAQRVRWAKGQGLRLYLGADATARLLEDIAPYLPGTMRRKLPEGARSFDGARWDLGAARPTFAPVIEARARPYRHGRRVAQTTYHIGVDGTRNFVANGTVVHNTQDSGAVIELIRPRGEGPDAPIIGIATMDAARCFPTGNPTTPVIYIDGENIPHELKDYQVRQVFEMPAAQENAVGGAMYTIQYCALTRMLRSVEILRNIAIYQDEKLSGKFMKRIHLVKGIDVRKIEDAVAKATSISDAAGLTRYQVPAVIGGPDPQADVGHDTIDLASLPDNFDLDQAMKWYITQIAMAFNTDYQEFAPLPGGGLGTSQQSEVLHLKNRGKGPALFQKTITQFLNTIVLPANVSFLFDEQDLDADDRLAEVKLKRAQARQTDMSAGVLDVPGARQQALDAGDLTREIFDAMGERDLEEEQQADDERRFQPDPPPLTPEEQQRHDSAAATHQAQPPAQVDEVEGARGAAKERDPSCANPYHPAEWHPAQDGCYTVKEATPPGREEVEEDVEDEVSTMLRGVHKRIRDRIRAIERAEKGQAQATPGLRGRRIVETQKVKRDERGRVDEVRVIREEAS